MSSNDRTQWAEQHVEEFIGPVFVREFVFRSPQALQGALEHEVADFLIATGSFAILVSQKCQERPGERGADRTRLWAKKQAKKAVSQLKGALRRKPRPVWCKHWRRGRVTFEEGLPTISHAVALIEVFDKTALEGEPSELPLEYNEIPITYLSVSDFLNLSQELRTIAELANYFNERRSLSRAEALAIGDERVVFLYYLLHNGSLQGFSSREECRSDFRAMKGEVLRAIAEKIARDKDARIIEYVADQLSGRHPSYREGLSESVLSNFEPDGARTAYLAMQELFANMRLAERAEPFVSIIGEPG